MFNLCAHFIYLHTWECVKIVGQKGILNGKSLRSPALDNMAPCHLLPSPILQVLSILFSLIYFTYKLNWKALFLVLLPSLTPSMYLFIHCSWSELHSQFHLLNLLFPSRHWSDTKSPIRKSSLTPPWSWKSSTLCCLVIVWTSHLPSSYILVYSSSPARRRKLTRSGVWAGFRSRVTWVRVGGRGSNL